MKITFLGTKGYIEARTRKHYRHTSTLITYKRKKIMIDCGIDWAKKVWQIKPDAIILTHAHPDHVWGLKEGSPCPVYATRTTWKLIDTYLIRENQRNIIYMTKQNKIFGVTFKPFKVEHSLIAPAVSYRITANKKIIFYAGDVAYLPKRSQALKNVQLYIGDGSTITTPLIRKKEGKIYGHATVKTQLAWCKKSHVPWAIFTHCGTEIVTSNFRTINTYIRKLGKERNVNAEVAYDNMTIKL